MCAGTGNSAQGGMVIPAQECPESVHYSYISLSAFQESEMFPINDMLDAILLGGFFFGLLFTVGVLVLGVADIGIDSDTDVDADHGGDGFFNGMFNISSLLAFITWTGGVGYIARNGLGLWTWAAVLTGLVGGVAGAAIVAWVFMNVLKKGGEGMNPADWNVVGVLGRVTSSIRSNGYGEIVYEQNGLRQVASAKASGEQAIPRDTEVVVLRIERGVAVVEPFDELLGDRDAGRVTA